MKKLSPLDHLLQFGKLPGQNDYGYGWRCPFCHVAQDEGQQTGTYWEGKAVCATCAPLLNAARKQTSG